MNIEKYNKIKQTFSDLKADKRYAERSLKDELNKNDNLKIDLKVCLESRIIIQTIAEQTQKTIEEQFNQLVTSCLKAIFPQDLEFRIKFVQKRNKTECDCFIVTDGYEGGVFDGGFGASDVCSFGCRIAFMMLENKTRKIMWLDEPVSYLHSQEMQENFSDVLQMLYDKYGIQFIVVSNQKNIVGDKKFWVEKGIVSEI